MNATASALDDVLPAMRRLDRILEKAVSIAVEVYGPHAAADPFRGLHLGENDVRILFDRDPGAPLLWGGDVQIDEGQRQVDQPSRLTWLKKVYGLSSFDIDIVLIALAPEIDLRYERLYAYLQDDVTKKRPAVNLALDLLCSSVEAKLASRFHFGTNAPLVSNELLRLITDPNQVQPPLLAHYLKLDEQIIHLILDQPGLDSRLASFCRFVEPDEDINDLPIDAEIKQALFVLSLEALKSHQPLQFYFHGPAGTGKRRCAEALAQHLDVPLLIADLERLSETNAQFDVILTPLMREACFSNALLMIDGLETLLSKQQTTSYESLKDKLATDNGITILIGDKLLPESSAELTNVITVEFPKPGFTNRRICWQESLARYDLVIEGVEKDALSERFCLTPNQIERVVADSSIQARWRHAAQTVGDSADTSSDSLLVADLYHAVRTQSGHELAALAQKIEPRYSWDDIVLPHDTRNQLHEICQRVVHRHRVLDEWGFDRKLSLGKGVNALFAGPSGAGKTMAAEVIANELQLDLYKIDLSGVVSKYIGETEKNLERIFTTAENSNAILLFDEADALFGKRSEVRDSHDRYSNLETCYLLQKIEQFDGTALLATNQIQNLDAAFTRRLAFITHFPFPNDTSRQCIWKGIWPAETPVAEDVDLEFLASHFKLSGGNIKNIALAASFLAAEDGELITMANLLQATRREYQKMGKVLSDAELNPIDKDSAQDARSAA